MKNINILLGMMISLLAISCGPAKVLNNYATTTEEIYKLEKGMSVSDVNSVLKSEPKDIYSNTAGQTKVLVYIIFLMTRNRWVELLFTKTKLTYMPYLILKLTS